MRLFVDDFRECPAGWTQARTITEAIRLLATQDIEEVSLDHDIICSHNGCFQGNFESFEPVAYYIEARGLQHTGCCDIRIHTGNIEAGRRMAEIIGIPYENKIFDPKDYL